MTPHSVSHQGHPTRGLLRNHLSAVARLKPEFGSSINTITDSVELCDNTSGIAILGELCDRALSITFLARICSCSKAIADFD